MRSHFTLVLTILSLIVCCRAQSITVWPTAPGAAACASPFAGIEADDGSTWYCGVSNTLQQSAAGGGAAWGAITGTLSSQTDLQSALDAKVPTSTTVNGHALSSNVTVTNADLGAVPTSTTVNGHALSSNVTVTNSDLGAVPTSTTVNGHALSANVTVSASDLSTGTLPHAQLPTLLSGDIPSNAANTSGNAATSTALASTPTLCSSGQAPTGVLANGNATGCTVITAGGQAVAFLTANSATSATNTLVNSGMAFSLAASTSYSLDCNILFTVSATSAVGLTLGVTGAGTPSDVTLIRQINTTATAFRVDSTSSAAWGAKVGATATTVTSLSLAHFYGVIQNGTSAGTMNVQFANIGTTGTVLLNKGSWCKLQ